ncbi:hypothetical protein [Thermaerobacter subterraneus]|uniref:Uncharacterized protein n=1 Tax=Thermaerobacter subterraneus DSM 13965 TaxID=867903 RepID=K6PQT0_9FIRM|nr:hypothetical protein [Thermaerobacter subterraneus]EKP95297.1 hypothetical protein ThesuDRAFT_01042 [Thermaerobacter subterraneus DSM 13965]
MLAWQVERLGPPREVLRLTDVPEPVVEPGTVKIRVEAAGFAGGGIPQVPANTYW